jgi:hypothetical protein
MPRSMASSEITWVRYTWSLDDLADHGFATLGGGLRHGSRQEAVTIDCCLLP